MSKRITALVIAVFMAVSLTACRGNVEIGPDTTGATTEPQSVVTTAPPVFREITLVDDENCTFKITAIGTDDLWGYTLKVFLENKTGRNLMFSLDDVSVNGFMCDPFWASTVNAGMKSNEEICFSASDFERNGITEVTNIEFTLSVYDSDNWTDDRLVDHVFNIYPLGEEAVKPYERKAQPGDTVLFDNENCTMIITGYDPNSTWGYEAKVFLKNNTNKTLMFSLSDASVNGYMCDPYWAVTVAPGKCSNTSIIWSASALEENGITRVERLTLPVRVYPEDDWQADAYIDETFEVKP